MEHQLDQIVLKKAAKWYGITLHDLKEISEGFQNKVFRYSKNNRNYILRFTPKEKRTRDMLHEELSWVQFLKTSGVAVCGVVQSTNNQLLEEVDDFYVTTFEKAPGVPIHVENPIQWNPNFFHRWGNLLGQVHLGGNQFSVEITKTSRLRWSHEHPYNHNLFKVLPSDLVKNKYQELVERMKRFPMDHHHFGLIHNDFHQGNFFVDQDNMMLFDFDDCAYFYYAYDIAAAFYHAYWQHTSFNTKEDDFTVSYLTHFLNGYAEANTLTSGMVDQLPVFLKLREIFLYVLFLKVWDKDRLQDWQVYTIRNLKANIENNSNYAGLDTSQLNQIKQRLKKPL